MESTKRTSLTLFLRRGHIRSLALHRTNQPSQIVDGIHSITTVCSILKLSQQGIEEEEEDSVVVAAMIVATTKNAVTRTTTAEKMS